MSVHNHDYELLTWPDLNRHLASEHGYTSSNDLENFTVTHRRLHGVETPEAQRIREIRHDAWREGYEACRQGKQKNSPYRDPA